ncbi:MAG TPA: signal peptidase I [Ruminiclostridium sp.]|nr:signal peptidase I [Ruminiclostridium sp.]
MNKHDLKNLLDWVLHIVLAIALGLLITVFLGRLTVVDGNSMNSTLQNGDVIIIEAVTPRFGTIQSGDIVVLKIPELLENRKKYAIKRVIATENEHVEIRDGKVFIDGSELSEPYVSAGAGETAVENSLYADITVPEGCIYVLGDNRIPDKSRDSRAFGPVSTDRILGKSWIRIFPFSNAGYVR